MFDTASLNDKQPDYYYRVLRMYAQSARIYTLYTRRTVWVSSQWVYTCIFSMDMYVCMYNHSEGIANALYIEIVNLTLARDEI